MTEQATSKEPVAKRLSRTTPMGMVAAARYPARDERKTVADNIRAQDADLVSGTLAPVAYKSLTVCGVDLKLEPVAPALGTVVHGANLDRDLENPEMVQFLRDLWLERRVIMFRDQQQMTRDGLIRFGERFGELGAHH